MKNWYVKFMVLTMASGMLFQLGGCAGNLILQFVGVALLHQFATPLLGNLPGNLFGTGGP